MRDAVDGQTLPEPRTDRKALVAAWLGWTFDGLDSYLYVAVATVLVEQLVRAHEPGLSVAALNASVTEKAALIQAFFFFGWALGGAVFGRLGDKLGRTRTLSLTILTYAIFTGLGYFATEWWHLLVFRFLAALGIGGEWAAGSALVSETIAPRHRAWASALLQSGYILGIMAATLTGGFFRSHDPRLVFVVGVLPALCVLWIRSHVREPESWTRATQSQRVPGVAELFSAALRRTTITLAAFISLALVGAWVFVFFMPQVVRRLPEFAGASAAELTAISTRVALVYFSVNLAGNFVATYLARHVGPRWAFAIFSAGALACGLWAFGSMRTLSGAYIGACGMAFFALGMFAIFPLYIPPLFPPLLRTLGSGFTYNFGRLVTGVGTIFAGELAKGAGGPSGAVWASAWLYAPMLALCLALPSTVRDKPHA
jgi:predicted MFS family arabinose efflux permease